jgi:large conductance mechanosensitive channel
MLEWKDKEINMPLKKPQVFHKTVTGFFQFIREQGVVGLAIGFILGGAINKLVGSLVADVIQPAINMIFGGSQGLADLRYGSIMYGKFLANIIDFIVLSAVVYFGFKMLRLDQLDLKKEEKK